MNKVTDTCSACKNYRDEPYSSSGARLGARKVVRAEKDRGSDEVSAGRAVGNVVHAGTLTLALVLDARNLMTSLRLLVALLGAWDARCDRPWQ